MLKSSQRPTGDQRVMVPDAAFENFVSGTTADVAAHGGRPRSYGYDVKRCGFLEHLHSPGAERGVPMQRRADYVRRVLSGRNFPVRLCYCVYSKATVQLARQWISFCHFRSLRAQG